MSIAAGTETTTSLDVLEALDFEAAPHCEVVDCKERPVAKWYGVPDCSCVKPVCEPCRASIRQWLDDEKVLVCTKCGYIVWDMRFEPVGGKW